MKFLIPLAALVSSGISSAQTAAVTAPVGYTTNTLQIGFNSVGLTLQTQTKAAGDINVATSNSVQDTTAGVNFTTSLGATGTLHVLEITSGPALGLVTEINNWTTDTITTVDNLAAAGVVNAIDGAGATYRIRKCPTLEEIFTLNDVSAGGVLKRALSSGSADIVWFPNGAGGFQKYYLRSGASPEFRNVATNTAAPNTPVVYPDGMWIEKKTADAASLTVTGEVKTVGTSSSIAFGYNLVNIVVPVGMNLFNAGLEDNLKPALSSGSADLVWVQQPGGAFAKYFRRSGASPGWRLDGATVNLTQAQAEAVVFPNSFVIQKKDAGTTPLSLNVPTFYNSL